MKRPSPAVLALLVVGGFLVATNPVVADAAGMVTGSQIKNNTITSADVKDRSLLVRDFKTGQLPRGAKGATGAKGAPGTPGTPGTSGTSTTVQIAGAISTIPVSVLGDYVFAGPTVTVSAESGQRLVASAGMILGTSASGPLTVQYGLCYRPNGSTGEPANFAGVDYSEARLAAEQQALPLAGSAVVSASGLYEVGGCVDNESAASLDDNQEINGWVQVVDNPL